MIRFAALILLLVTLASCATTPPAALPKDYWTKAPDLSKVTYEGGDGKTPESPILIRNAANGRDGIAAEYAFIEKAHGEKSRDWRPTGQSSFTKDGRQFDAIKVQVIATNETLTYYFDISEFYGKY
jgi:hypothetical protein